MACFGRTVTLSGSPYVDDAGGPVRILQAHGYHIAGVHTPEERCSRPPESGWRFPFNSRIFTPRGTSRRAAGPQGGDLGNDHTTARFKAEVPGYLVGELLDADAQLLLLRRGFRLGRFGRCGIEWGLTQTDSNIHGLGISVDTYRHLVPRSHLGN